MNLGHWMEGAYGVPTWMWLTAIAAGCLLLILYILAMMASSAERERVERRRLFYLEPEEQEELYPAKTWKN